MSSRTVHDSNREISIDYNYNCSDHLPLTLKLDYPYLPVSITECGSADRINWNFSDEAKVDRLYHIIYRDMRALLTHSNTCGAHYCTNSSHKSDLDEIYCA